MRTMVFPLNNSKSTSTSNNDTISSTTIANDPTTDMEKQIQKGKTTITTNNDNSIKCNITDNEEHNIARFQFKDYSEWTNNELVINKAKNEDFWINYIKNYEPKDSFEKDFVNRKNNQNCMKLY